MYKSKFSFTQPDDRCYKGQTKHNVALHFGQPVHELCSVCGVRYEVDMLAVREPLTPVQDALGRFWVRQTCQIMCPECGGLTEHKLPTREALGEYYFFGDESYREEGDQLISVLSVVGINASALEAVDEKISSLKRSFAPDADPSSWKIHIKVLSSKEKRMRDPILKDWDDAKVNSFIEALINFLPNIDKSFLAVNCSAICHKPKDVKKREQIKKFLKYEVYSGLLMEVIRAAVESNVRPYFIFDAEKDFSGELAIQGWAKDIFYSIQKTLQYAYISQGIIVNEPIFVKPASGKMLELADFVSYMTARYIFCKLNRKKIVHDMTKLGPMKYIVFDKDGDMIATATNHVGYPWELMK